MAEKENLGQDDIEALLQAAQADQNSASQPPPSAATPASDSSTSPAAAESAAASATPASGATANVDADVQQLLNQAEQALASVDQPVASDVPGLQPFELKDFSTSPPSTDKASLELLRDVELNLRVELGRTHMHLQDVLQLRKGSVVQLDRPAGDPVDIFVNGRLVARGEVLVLNDTFCIRVGELISSNETD